MPSSVAVSETASVRRSDFVPSQDYIDLYRYLKQNKYYVQDRDRVYLEQYVVKGIPEQLRRKYWLTVSGAYSYLKHYGDGYYQTICQENSDEAYPNWPHPDYLSIQKDLTRTFSEEPFFQQKETQDKIKRVLTAFVRRNPIQGYIQCMNYIVARLIQVVEEEEAFWIFTIIMEKYLPLDYMLFGLTGAMTDQKVFEHFVNYTYPDVLEKLKNLKLAEMAEFSSLLILKNTVISWYNSLFSYHIPKDLAIGFFDLFLLNGNHTLFYFSLSLIGCCKRQIFNCQSVEELQGEILKGTRNKEFQNTRKIL